jgi:Rab proteins geranylgeranyltransferase component A
MSSTPGKSAASRRYSVSLTNLDETIDCDLLISSIEPPDPGVTAGVARCIAIINRPLVFASPETQETDTPPEGFPQTTDTTVDTALVIFPPSVLPGGSETTAAHVFVTGEGSMSAPKGNCASRPPRH